MKTLKFKNGSISVGKQNLGHEITLEEWRDNGFVNVAATVLLLPNDADIPSIEGDLFCFETIIVNFPTFKDGRAFSQARRLREQYGFTGEIRARGDIGRDQVLFMLRSGINAVEASEEMSQGFEDALREY